MEALIRFSGEDSTVQMGALTDDEEVYPVPFNVSIKSGQVVLRF